MPPVQELAEGDVKGLQVAGSLLRALKPQAELAAGADAEPLQAQRGRQRDADARRGDCERRQMVQMLPCTPQH